jgi:hypothetical protein
MVQLSGIICRNPVYLQAFFKEGNKHIREKKRRCDGISRRGERKRADVWREGEQEEYEKDMSEDSEAGPDTAGRLGRTSL